MAQILIDGKPLAETTWEVDGKTMPGDEAFKIVALASPYLLPVGLGGALLGYFIGKGKKD